MKFYRLIVPAATLALVMTFSLANAGPGGCCGAAWGPGGGKGLGMGPIWSDLTADQQKKLEALQLEFLKKNEAINSDIRKKQIEMRELAANDKYDDAAVEKKREEIWTLADKMRDERRALNKQLRDVLTPEQKQKLGTMGPGVGCGFGPGGYLGGMGACQAFGRGGCPRAWDSGAAFGLGRGRSAL